MRILVASTHRALAGGVETYLQELLPSLRARGHDVGLAYEQPSVAGQDTVDAAADVPAWEIAAGTQGLRCALTWRPDVVFSQGLVDPDIEEALLNAAPVALFAHGYYGTCISGTKRHAWPRTCPCEKRRGTGCLLYYFPRRCGGLNPLTMVAQYRRQARRDALLRRFDAIFVASRHMQSEYRRHGVAESRLHLNALFPPGELPDAQPPADRPPTKRILFVGRLTDVKGCGFLIKAIRRASHILGCTLSLVVAGDGPEKPWLMALARRLQVPAEFHGWVNATRRRELMRQADVLAVPSVWPEPFGLVGVEAACVGLPAVAFAVGGIPDWLRPGKSGELAPANPPRVAALAEALVRALAEPSHLAHLRLGAWETAASFTRERHLDSLEQVFLRLAAAQGPTKSRAIALEPC